MEPDFTEHLVFRICLWSLITIYYGHKTKLNGNSAKGKEIDRDGFEPGARGKLESLLLVPLFDYPFSQPQRYLSRPPEGRDGVRS